MILEPDGLGIIPYNTDINGNHEWCQPDLTGTGLTPATANSERYVQLNAAVDRLEQLPNVNVYLDGTHPRGSASATSPTGSSGPASAARRASS